MEPDLKRKNLFGEYLIKGADVEDLNYLNEGNVQANSPTLKELNNSEKQSLLSNEIAIGNNINSLKHSLMMAKRFKIQR